MVEKISDTQQFIYSEDYIMYSSTPYSEIMTAPLHLPGIDVPKIIPGLPDAWTIG